MIGACRVTGSHESDRLTFPLAALMKSRGCDETVLRIWESIALRNSLLCVMHPARIGHTGQFIGGCPGVELMLGW